MGIYGKNEISIESYQKKFTINIPHIVLILIFPLG